MSEFEIVPVEGGWTETGQCAAYEIKQDGRPVWYLSPGNTGSCWNITDPYDADEESFHICELDEFIAALTALRDSEAHRENVARWAFP